MGTIRRIRRHWQALVFGAALFGAVGPHLARAESFSAAEPTAAYVQPFVPQDSFATLPLLVRTDAAFERTAAALDADAVAVATRADMDRLSAPGQEPDAVVVASDEAPIERRITLVFARFDETDAEARATTDSARAQSDFAAAARRWTPAVSSMLVALALPIR